MAIDLPAITEALRLWVVAQGLLPDGQVILQDQAGPQLTPPYATLRVNSTGRPFPMDYRDSVTQLELDPGEEVLLTTSGHRTILVSVNIYTAGTFGGAGAQNQLQTLCDTLELQSVMDAFAAAGFVVMDISDVQNLSILLETNFQGRAHVELTLGATTFVNERTGYIGEISGQGTVSVVPDDVTPTLIPFDVLIPQ